MGQFCSKPGGGGGGQHRRGEFFLVEGGFFVKRAIFANLCKIGNHTLLFIILFITQFVIQNSFYEHADRFYEHIL